MTEQPAPTAPGSPEPAESAVLRELAGFPDRLAALDHAELHEHPAVYRGLHEQLTAALADADPGADPGAPAAAVAGPSGGPGRPQPGQPQPGRPGGFRPGPPRGR